MCQGARPDVNGWGALVIDITCACKQHSHLEKYIIRSMVCVWIYRDLCVYKDGQSNFEYTECKIEELFVRPRSSILLRKYRDLQFMVLHGIIYTTK